MASSGDAAPALEGTEGGGDNNSSAELYESEQGGFGGGGGRGGGGGGGGGNRWPRQETLALLKIRSDMDAVFRDASVKGPLWEDVSRKLGELGYHRSAKKCKEKFENVYKYHKRTKDGRTGKHEKKTYRFFDQLEALENQFPSPSIPPPPPQVAATTSTAGPPFTVTSVTTHHHITMPQSNVTPSTAIVPPAVVPSLAANVAANPTRGSGVPSSVLPNVLGDLAISDASVPSSSSTSSDEELGAPRRRGRKRKWRGFFERLTKEVMDKQEAMHRKFLEVIEKREHERMAREEAWRVQEIARINREREILAQERSVVAAKDAAVMSFLQKIAEQQVPGQGQANPSPTPLQPQPPVRQVPSLSQQQPVSAQTMTPGEIIRYSQAQSPVVNMEIHRSTNNGNRQAPPSSSRWPKVEVEALINLRTNLESKYQENGPKGPLWEEISAAMRKLGYNRNAKRCKEKWENINKYFKKVKESNKQRPEDSKTCPYFHQLDALYKEKNYKFEASASQLPKPESLMAPLMVTPEQQWPPPPVERQMVDSTAEDVDSDRNHDEEEGDEEDDEEGDYEVVANKPSSVGANSEDTHDS